MLSRMYHIHRNRLCDGRAIQHLDDAIANRARLMITAHLNFKKYMSAFEHTKATRRTMQYDMQAGTESKS